MKRLTLSTSIGGSATTKKGSSLGITAHEVRSAIRRRIYTLIGHNGHADLRWQVKQGEVVDKELRKGVRRRRRVARRHPPKRLPTDREGAKPRRHHVYQMEVVVEGGPRASWSCVRALHFYPFQSIVGV